MSRTVIYSPILMYGRISDMQISNDWLPVVEEECGKEY